MPCEEFVPLHLLYDKGRLKGFSWIFLGSLPSNQNRYEYFNNDFYSVSTVYGWLFIGFITVKFKHTNDGNKTKKQI